MKTRIIHTKIWDDEFFQSLSQETQLVFLYILTCQDINICGAFELADRKILYYTNISPEQLETAKSELLPKVIFKNGWVIVKNVDKYNRYVGEKNDTARKRELELVPEEIRYCIDTSINTSIHTTLYHNHNQKSEYIENGLGKINQKRKELGL